MSFDVFAQAFRDGDAGIGNAEAARAVLSGLRYEHNPEFDSYMFAFADGSHLEMYAGGLDGRKPFKSAMFALRGVSDAIGEFMFLFAHAAGFALLPAMEPACVLLTRDEQRSHLPSDLSDDFQVLIIASGGELLAALDGGYDAWSNYRDKIIGRATGGT